MIKLSVIIISHNQRDVLRRCIKSVLAQNTTFPVEVIVSDDRSTDGTREMIESEFHNRVIYTTCNSDECHPNYILERAGYNRLNGLKYATGKYLIHVDGDDFFLGTGCFEEMVQTLESHPECTLCCQNFRWVDDGVDPLSVSPFCKSPLFEQSRIISGDEYVMEIGFVHNSAVCARRAESANLANLSPNTYDDADITFRYMGTGKIALINRADFVYVQYSKSSCSTVSDLEKTFIFPNGVTSIQLNPFVSMALLKVNISPITSISWKVISNEDLPAKMVNYFANFRMFLYSALSTRNNLSVKFRYISIFITCILIRKGKMHFEWMYKLLYKLVV